MEELKAEIKQLQATVESLKDSLLTAEREKAELAVELATIRIPKLRGESHTQGPRERTEIIGKPWSVEAALEGDIFDRVGQNLQPSYIPGFSEADRRRATRARIGL